MRNLDFSSLHALITTLLSLAVITLIGVGMRLFTMVTIQQRRERMNRQINERLRALIAAYKTLGGSFTGDLSVDPAHRRDLRRHAEAPAIVSTVPSELSMADSPGSDRARPGPGCGRSGLVRHHSARHRGTGPAGSACRAGACYRQAHPYPGTGRIAALLHSRGARSGSYPLRSGDSATRPGAANCLQRSGIN